jgi:glutathione S-transferase
MTTLYAEKLWDSPFVFTVFVALREKGIDFEEVELDLSTGAHTAGSFADSSLTARVPTLDYEGFVLSESVAIVEYLDEKLPPPGHPALMGATPEERARCRQVLGWLRSDLRGLRADRPTTSMFFEEETGPLSEKGAKDAARLCALAERFTEGRDHLLESGWCIADADLTFMLQRLLANGDEVPEPLARYARATWERPSVQAYVNHPRPAHP